MKNLKHTPRVIYSLTVSFLLTFCGNAAFSADHNDPNAVNSIFSDIDISPADLYGMFGYPGDDRSDGESLIVQLTFASIPATGIFDQDMLYKIKLDPDPRIGAEIGGEKLRDLLKYARAVKDKYAKQKAAEIKVTFNSNNEARIDFIGLPGGDFFRKVPTNTVLNVDSPAGEVIKVFIGGRDDPFFNDLPGFFRSVNYGPQFYNIPIGAAQRMREFTIPKTLLELEGNTIFNRALDSDEFPEHRRPQKKELPAGPYTLKPERFLKNKDGNYRRVYSGADAQAGFNVNAIVVELPYTMLTNKPETERIVRVWGESWVLKASGKVPHAKSCRGSWWRCLFRRKTETVDTDAEFITNDSQYKLVDTVGVPFLDAGLSEREDELNVGANNIRFARRFVRRLGHLGWGFGPSVTALGLGSCFDHGNAPVSVHKKYWFATPAFKRGKKCSLQELNMPDDSHIKTPGVDIKPLRTFEIFIPNVTSVDMDTNGTWPYGRRLEDQVASRFLSVFLDMETGCGGDKCNVETLQNQATWDGAPVEPRTPPNPASNDKPFLDEFPYLAEPW